MVLLCECNAASCRKTIDVPLEEAVEEVQYVEVTRVIDRLHAEKVIEAYEEALRMPCASVVFNSA